MEDKLQVGCKGLRKYVSVGVFEEEQKLKCLLEFNCTVEIDISKAEYESARTLNYVNIIEAINQISSKSYKLLEEVAEDIIYQISRQGNSVLSVELEIIKKNPVLLNYSGDVFIKVKK